MTSILPWCETAAIAISAALAALYASRGRNLARNFVVAVVLASWAGYRLFGTQ